MIGYLIFGAPNILLLGFLTCFATIIPMVGTALVWFPVAAYLAISGDWFHAIGLAAYGAIVVSQSDNLIRFILQRKWRTHIRSSLFSELSSVCRYSDLWGHLRSVITLAILPFREYVQERISGFAK